MEKMKSFLFTIGLLLLSLSAKSEIFSAVSLEALAMNADMIVQGKVVEIKKVRTMEGEASFIHVAIDSIFKGQPADSIWVQTCTYTNIKEDYLLSKEALFFLKKYPASEEIFTLLETVNTCQYSFFDVSKPFEVYTGNFDVITDKAQLYPTLRKTIDATNEKSSEIGMLTVPYNTNAHKYLYHGSTCYLYVPKLLFTEAK